MFIVAYTLSLLINLYILVIIIQVALSWLIAFEVVNSENKQAQNLMQLLKKLTDPVYKPLRKYIPPIGGIDITPLIVIIGLQLIDYLVVWKLFGRMMY
jgi:YggT family protein